MDKSLSHLEEIIKDLNKPERYRRTYDAVASRFFFHLEEPAQSLRLALERGEEKFDVVGDWTSAYIEYLVGATIDSYVKRKRGLGGDGRDAEEGKGADNNGGDNKDGDAENAGLDKYKVDCLFPFVFERCYVNYRYGHALGILFEAWDIFRVQEVLDSACSDPRFTPTKAQAALMVALDASMILEEAPTVTAAEGYAEGGSIYTLGLIHRSRTRWLSSKNRGDNREFLHGKLWASNANKVIIHGVALGVGLTDLDSAGLGILNDLKELLYTKSDIPGESEGMAICMVLVVSWSGNVTYSSSAPAVTKYEEMLEVVSELQIYAR